MEKGFIRIIGGGKCMKDKCQKVDFSSGILEFRADEEEICIYGTTDGLRWLAQKCLALVDKGEPNHLHLEDYEILTKESKKTVLALFKKKDKSV